MENYNCPIEINYAQPTYMIENESIYKGESAIMKTFQISSNENTIVHFEGLATPSTFEKMIDGLNAIEVLSSKIQFLQTAFKNRTKQYNFSQLICSMLENEISEADFELEIENNADFYAISISEEPIKISDLDVLISLITELKGNKLLKDDVSIDEVTELFEVNLDNVTNRIADLKLIE